VWLLPGIFRLGYVSGIPHILGFIGMVAWTAAAPSP
jgi:hypothetical protein